MSVVGFSLITNVHLTGRPTSHAEVVAAAQHGATNVAQLIEGIVANIDAPLPAPPEIAHANAAPSEDAAVADGVDGVDGTAEVSATV
jgi:hypothetical protein